MSYLGKTGLNHANIKRWTGTPGVTDVILFSTLGFTPFNEQSCIITVNGVKQHDTSFVLTGSKIQFSANLSVADEVEVIAILSVGLPLRPADNSVQRKHLVSDLRNITQDKFSGNASTTAFTLSFAPYSASSILVFLNGVSQLAGTDYTVSSKTLTFTTPPITGTNNINVIHLVYATGTAEIIPADDSITEPKLATGAVTKVYNGSNVKLSSTTTGIDITGSVTATGNVGIGLGSASPTQKLHVTGDVVIDKTNNGYSGLRIHDDSSSDYVSYIDLGRNQNGTRLVIRNGGRVQGTTPWANSTGNTICSFARGGIAFGSDTAAANTLDDYEEGTWTPTINDSSTASNEGQVYAHNAGYFTKIGDVVHCWGKINITSLGSMTTSSATYILGLPFIANPATYFRPQMLVGYGSSLNFTAGNSLTGFGSSGSSWIRMANWDAGAGYSNLTISELSVNANIHFYIIYKV